MTTKTCARCCVPASGHSNVSAANTDSKPRISRKSYYKESDVLEFISRNMEEVVLDAGKCEDKEGTGKKSPGKTKEKKGGRRTASRL